MRVIYLTWGETPRSYGVFSSQVIGQFVETSKLLPEYEFHFVSAVPLIHSGLVREKWHYFSELSSVKDKLKPVRFHWLPIVSFQNFVNSTRATFPFMHGVAHFFLKNKLEKLAPDIVHCRSYHAAWAAMVVREKYNLSYKVIFDGRGLWPEEVALKRNWPNDHLDYKFLKSIENELLEKCDATVTVSDTMHDHYVGLGATRDRCIYLSADIEQLKVNIAEIKPSETVRFCYVGALAEDTWHQPKGLVELYRKLRTLFLKTKLTIVTTSNHDELKRLFSEFPQDELVLTSTKTRRELRDVLSHQDFGLMTYFTPRSENEKLLGQMVLAVKTAEYFVSALPMLCNAHCGGAAKMIKENDLGVTYFPDSINSLSAAEFLPFLSIAARERCQMFALKNFDYAVNARKYAELYKDILTKQ